MAKAPKKRAGGLARRIVTAIVAVPILLWLLFEGPAIGWLTLLTAAAAISLYEFYEITLSKEDVGVKSVGIALGTLLVPTIYFAPNTDTVIVTVVVAVLAVLFAALFSFGELGRSTALASCGVLGVLYVGVPVACLALLHSDPETGVAELGPQWVLLALAVVWAGDTGAYFSGRFLGRHKLAPRVSPKKTIEGSIGGVAASVGAAFLVVYLTPIELSTQHVLILAIPAAVLGQLGDLFESLIKRASGVKDSGTIIYGHGGMLDRIDGLILAAPYFYFFYAIGPSIFQQ